MLHLHFQVLLPHMVLILVLRHLMGHILLATTPDMHPYQVNGAAVLRLESHATIAGGLSHPFNDVA